MQSSIWQAVCSGKVEATHCWNHGFITEMINKVIPSDLPHQLIFLSLASHLHKNVYTHTYICIFICKYIRSNILSWLTRQWASDCYSVLHTCTCISQLTESNMWVGTALSNYVSVVLEEILRMVWFKTENHNIYHLTTEDTKIYDITKKNPNLTLLSKESTGSLCQSTLLLLGNEWSHPFLVTASPSLCSCPCR